MGRENINEKANPRLNSIKKSQLIFFMFCLIRRIDSGRGQNSHSNIADDVTLQGFRLSCT